MCSPGGGKPFYRIFSAVFLAVLLGGFYLVQAQDGELKILPFHQVLAIDETLHLPSDVAVDGQERIYVLDGTADLVRVYDSSGTPLALLGGSSLLNQPLGLDVTDKGDVLVADSGNHRLVLFPEKDRPPVFLPIPPAPNGKPADPTDAVFSLPDGVFHAVDNENHRIMTLDSHGKVLRSVGLMGRNKEEFRFPFMLDKDVDGNLYIVEVINTRVQVLTPDGRHSRFIGDWGIEPGQFFRPKGIAVSDQGEVYVSDSYLGVIQVFSGSGEFLGIVGDSSGQLIKFTTPVGLAISDDRLMVVEMFKNRLLVLKKGTP